MSIGHPDFVGVSVKQLADVLIGQAIAANSSDTRPAVGQFSIYHPGYEIQLNVATLAGTANIVSVELKWYDSTFGAIMHDETYYFYSGNLNGHLIHGRGPSKGDRLVVVITNHDAVNQVTVSYTLLQTDRVFTREFWTTITNGGIAPVFPGFTALNHNIAGNLVGTFAMLVPANTTEDLMMPFYTGTIRLMGTCPGAAVGTMQWLILPSADPSAAANYSYKGTNGQAGNSPFGVGSLYQGDIALPRSQARLQVVNTTAGAQNITAVLIAQEDRA